MDNYKIEVKDEAESKEAQELFFELGFRWKWTQDKEVLRESTPYLFTLGANIGYGLTLTKFDECVGKELTLPQLRDLVVLKRNDVKDSNCTYRLAAEEKNYAGYLDSNDWMHIFKDGGWQAYVPVVSEELKAFYLNSKAKDPALISIDDVWKAFWKAQKVQYSFDDDNNWQDDIESLKIEDIKSGHYQFRLKPQTIKVELELPKPFEPKVGDLYWCIAMTNLRGYTQKVYKDDGDDECLIHLGAYRTEDEIKQVVDQLRKIRGTNS
ncbi:hypothetical protein [Acinetobacter baumannii]|uniref:hypothetical protein n=1 Tax=Acinetobacter baumannii TaxID=470 RepID=UPI000E906585|nr:hypothetical protein [Acinetobacter baumannii]AXX53894.1 hypothetical protein Aba9102_16700 [Acinetobacter baumannii]